MKRNRNIQIVTFSLMLASIVGLISGCKDVFEEDISKKQLIINSPLDGTKSVVYKQLFWWDKLEGASQYSIQVATPSFDSLVSIVADTIVVGVDKFYKTLSPGEYQWRIRAENGGYKTEYQTYNLTMLVSPLELQEVNLVAPANNTYHGFNDGANIEFIWDEIPGATKYEINIDTLTGGFGTGLYKSDETTINSYNFSLPSGGEFKWRVKAKNDEGGETPWSDIYRTGYYGSLPSRPLLATPTATTGSVTFSWGTITNGKTYTLNLYYTAADTLGAAIHSYSTTDLSKTAVLNDLPNGGFVYGIVTVTDKAGNVSPNSYSKNVAIP